MDPNALAGMAFTLILAAMVGGFILLFPIARRLGLLLEGKIQDRKDPVRAELAEARKLKEHIEALEAQLKLLSERHDFTEQLLARKEKTSLPP